MHLKDLDEKYYHKEYYYIEKSPMHPQNAEIDNQQTSWQNSMALAYSQFDSIYISNWLELIWKESYVRISTKSGLLGREVYKEISVIGRWLIGKEVGHYKQYCKCGCVRLKPMKWQLLGQAHCS